MIRLLSRGVSVTAAEKICAGRYPANIRNLLAMVLLEEMAKDYLTGIAVPTSKIKVLWNNIVKFKKSGVPADHLV